MPRSFFGKKTIEQFNHSKAKQFAQDDHHKEGGNDNGKTQTNPEDGFESHWSSKDHNNTTFYSLSILKKIRYFYHSYYESLEKCSILFKVKEEENFNHRNTFSISRIKI